MKRRRKRSICNGQRKRKRKKKTRPPCQIQIHFPSQIRIETRFNVLTQTLIEDQNRIESKSVLCNTCVIYIYACTLYNSIQIQIRIEMRFNLSTQTLVIGCKTCDKFDYDSRLDLNIFWTCTKIQSNPNLLPVTLVLYI